MGFRTTLGRGGGGCCFFVILFIGCKGDYRKMNMTKEDEDV